MLCALCAVTNAEAVLDADPAIYASLVNVAGVAAAPSLSVQDVLRTYPAGTLAGFAVQKTSGLVEVSLLNALTLRTYLDGTLQETFTGAGQLLELTALLPILSIGGSDVNQIGFMANLPFDEIRISNGALAGVVNTVAVYGAFVDTRFVTEISPGVPCPRMPVALADHSGTPQGVLLQGNVSWNDRNPDGSVLTYSTTPVTEPLYGTLTLAADGNYTYQPSPDYTGRDSFAYEVCNTDRLRATAWTFLSVLPPVNGSAANQPPQPNTDFSETPAGTPVTGYAFANDVDPEGNNLTYTLAVAPKRGTLALSATGTYTYTPDPGLVGRDTAIINVCDDGSPSLCDQNRVVFFVYPGLPPTETYTAFAQNDVYATPVQTPVSGNPLSAELLIDPEVSEGTLAVQPDGNFTFTPETDFPGGTVHLAYRACYDGNCDTATLAVVVNTLNVPLPVKIVSFRGKMSGCEAVLHWQAQADDNFSHFELEQSADGRSFQPVARINACISNRVTDFEHRVLQPNGTFLYRLKLVEKDGSIAYSATVAVKSVCQNESAVQVYPNPARDWLTLTGAAAGAQVRIYDVHGRLVVSEVLKAATSKLNVSHLAPGMYQLVIDGQQETVISLSLSR